MVTYGKTLWKNSSENQEEDKHTYNYRSTKHFTEGPNNSSKIRNNKKFKFVKEETKIIIFTEDITLYIINKNKLLELIKNLARLLDIKYSKINCTSTQQQLSNIAY